MIRERCATTGKLKFATVNEAYGIVRSINKQNARRDSRRGRDSGPGATLTAFRCVFCGAYHVGHYRPKPKKRVKMRYDFIDE